MQSPIFYLRNPRIFLSVILIVFSRWIPESLYLKLMFWLNVGYRLNLKNPTTFNEKLQWLKLYDRKPLYTKMVDKYEAKDYVSGIIGNEYIIPTLGVWLKPEDIDWDVLPDQFVLKTTHGSGGSSVIICTDKKKFDKNLAIKKLKWSLSKSDTYQHYKEWPYKGIEKKIIAEQFLNDNGNVPNDYKIHCFNGIPKFILVCRDRYSDTGLVDDFYTPEWEHMDVKRPNKENPGGIPKPAELSTMLRLATILSAKIPFLRVDFYTLKGKVYFGELTFYPASGMVPFCPFEYDLRFGQWLTLPKL